MWSSNILLAYSLQQLNREKRERQPNWTESEKQLLLTLTRKYQAILENKGSDTMTLKLKSEAWEDVARHMKAAGYNRSKERLKQQLGRIRANEAKKIKEATERNLTIEEIQKLNINNNNNYITEENMKTLKMTSIKGNCNEIPQTSCLKISPLPVPEALQEHYYIKTEKSVINNAITYSQEEEDLRSNRISSCLNNVSNELNINACENNQPEDDHKILENLHFKLQNVKSLAENQQNIVDNMIINNDFNAIKACNIASDDNINSPSPPVKESNINLNNSEEENAASSSYSMATNINQMRQQQEEHLRLLRLRRVRNRRKSSTFTRQQSLHELYSYRIAIERERLRNLRIQQKRDRILYLKDIEIQNLKLQVLRNLTNQNTDDSRINF